MGQGWTLSSKKPPALGAAEFSKLRIAENEPLKSEIKINYPQLNYILTNNKGLIGKYLTLELSFLYTFFQYY